MSKRTIYTNVTARQTLPPAARTSSANGTSVSRNTGTDMHRTMALLVTTGTITDGTHTIELQDSDDGTSFTAVADEHLQGTEPVITSDDDDKVYIVGYTGARLHLRAVLTVSGAPLVGGVIGAVILLGEPRRGPVGHG